MRRMATENVIERHPNRIGAAWIREHLGLKTKDVARQVGRSASVFNRIENGLIGCDLDLGLKLAALYCCSPEEIKPRPSREQLDVIKDAFEVRKAKEVLARQADKKAGAA